MIVICPGCGKEYSFDEVSLPAAGAMGRCKACGTRFRIDRPGQEEQITCPACGFKQAGGSACLTCGLVFDKYKPRDEEQAETPSGATGRPRAAGSIPDALPPAEEEKTFGGSMGGPGGLKPPPDEIRFSLGGSFRFAWTVVRGNFLFLLAVLLLAMIISSIPDVLGRILFADSVPARLLLLFVSVFLQSVVTMGLVRVSLLFVDGREATFSDLFACASLFPAYFLASVLYGLMVFFGMLLLVVPGIILAIKPGSRNRHVREHPGDHDRTGLCVPDPRQPGGRIGSSLIRLSSPIRQSITRRSSGSRPPGYSVSPIRGISAPSSTAADPFKTREWRTFFQRSHLLLLMKYYTH